MTHKNIPVKDILEEIEPKDGNVFIAEDVTFHLEGGDTREVREFFLTTVPFMSGRVYITKGPVTTSRRRSTNFIPAKKVLFIERSEYIGYN
jgi:hypothetical protein